MPRTTAFIVAASLVLLAACGGDDDQQGVVGDMPTPPVISLPDDLDLTVPEVDYDAMIDDLLDELDALVTGSGGEGSGVVTVAGVRFEMASESCMAFDADFYIDGAATGSDGSIAWIDANRAVSTRADLDGLLDPETLDLLFGDDDTIDELYLEVRIGVETRLGYSDDDPNWTATGEYGSALGAGIVEFEQRSTTLTGRGEAVDTNGIGAAFGETVPIEFEFSCG